MSVSNVNYWLSLMAQEPYKTGRRYARLERNLQTAQKELLVRKHQRIDNIDKIRARVANPNILANDTYVERCLELFFGTDEMPILHWMESVVERIQSKGDLIRQAHQQHNSNLTNNATFRFRHGHDTDVSKSAGAICSVHGNDKRCACSCKCPCSEDLFLFDWSDQTKFNLDSKQPIGRVYCGWCECIKSGIPWNKCRYCGDFYYLNA